MIDHTDTKCRPCCSLSWSSHHRLPKTHANVRWPFFCRPLPNLRIRTIAHERVNPTKEESNDTLSTLICLFCWKLWAAKDFGRGPGRNLWQLVTFNRMGRWVYFWHHSTKLCWHLEPGIISKLKSLKKAVETFIVWCFYLCVFSQWIDYKFIVGWTCSNLCFYWKAAMLKLSRKHKGPSSSLHVVLNEVHLLAF